MFRFQYVKASRAAAVFATALFSASAFAHVTVTYPSGSSQYSFSGGGGSVISPGQVFSNSGGASGPDVTVSGWSNTGSGDSLETGTVKMWNGLGVAANGEPSGAPQHAADNNGSIDSILLSFASDFELQGLSIGWKKYDSDVTILAYTGNGAPTLAGKTYSELTASAGWQVIDHKLNLSVGKNKSINSGGISSSYWLVGAYNPLVGNSPGWSTGNDYIKISALTGTVAPPPPSGQVPAPSSILLLALGLLAVWHFGRPHPKTRQHVEPALAC